MLSRAVSSPSTDNPFYSFVVGYVIQLLSSASELLLFCSKVGEWPTTGGDLSEAGVIARKQVVVSVLHTCLGSLLISALTFLSKLGVHLERISDLVVALRQV